MRDVVVVVEGGETELEKNTSTMIGPEINVMDKRGSSFLSEHSPEQTTSFVTRLIFLLGMRLHTPHLDL